MEEAAVGSVVALVIVAAIAWVRLSMNHSASNSHHISLQGKAPYRTYTCTPSAESIETLSDIVRQLEDLEDQRDWEFDWQPIHQERWKAHQAIAKADYQAATVAYCSAVRLLMKAIRQTSADQPSDSTLDLG